MSDLIERISVLVEGFIRRESQEVADTITSSRRVAEEVKKKIVKGILGVRTLCYRSSQSMIRAVSFEEL